MRSKTRDWIKINDNLALLKRDDRQGQFYYRARIDGHKGYSLRHTYITNELELGQVSIHDIATNCGTSIQYIERHYSHAKVHSKAQELAEKVFGKNDVKADMKALFG